MPIWCIAKNYCLAGRTLFSKAFMSDGGVAEIEYMITKAEPYAIVVYYEDGRERGVSILPLEFAKLSPTAPF